MIHQVGDFIVTRHRHPLGSGREHLNKGYVAFCTKCIEEIYASSEYDLAQRMQEHAIGMKHGLRGVA